MEGVAQLSDYELIMVIVHMAMLVIAVVVAIKDKK